MQVIVANNIILLLIKVCYYRVVCTMTDKEVLTISNCLDYKYIYICVYSIYIYIYIYMHIYIYTPKGSLCRPIMHIEPAYVDRCFM